MISRELERLNNKYKDYLYFDKVKVDGKVVIASIFQFKDGYFELEKFIKMCSDFNCTIHFENENLDVIPHDNSNRSIINIYALIAGNNKFKTDFMNYLWKLLTSEYDSRNVQFL